MSTLAERINEILQSTGLSQAELARAAGVTEPAVVHWLSGNTHSLKGVVAARIEATTGFRAAWVASGKGQKLISPSQEEDMLLPREVELITALRQLSPQQQEAFLAKIREEVERNQEIVASAMQRLGVPDPLRRSPKR